MRILHLDSGAGMRGGQWQVYHLLRGLARAGHSVLLLAPPSSPLFEKAAAKGLAVEPLSWSRLLARSAAFDLVHAHDARSHTLAALFSRAPLLVSRRVAFPVKGTWASRWKYGRPVHYIAISETVKECLRAAGLPETRISVVFDGVELPDTPGFSEHGPILTLASEDPGKGAALVQEAARLAGVAVKPSSDLPRDLRNARLFVYVSEQEGLGSAALLAMAAGVPVVASAVGGLREIVIDGFTGFVTENRPECIAAVMKRALTDVEACRNISRLARRQVEEKFSLEAMVMGTLSVYEKVLSC
ncbi:MAG: glycosyltransferase family 4 protein [Bryobacteraceae bacterium]|jgi:Glycosyltransferase|nr:glycosyltransferase family 4 protein [Bryobacteraceae bacterium]